MRAIDDVLLRARGRRGAPRLADVLAHHRLGSTLTRSELEERFLALCRARHLPRPQVNAWIALQPTSYEADFLWRAERLDVELDGRHVHATPRAFERDRRRHQRLLVAGWRVVRFTARQLADEPDRVEATIRALLASTPAAAAS
jgi:very-short-patch-repair endonuclease